MKLLALFAALAACFQLSLAGAIYHPNPFHGLLQKRRTTSWNSTAMYTPSGPTVDLGYAIYQGVFNASWNLNIFKG